MRVREGSIADKCIRVSNWIDNTVAGNVIVGGLMAVLTVSMLVYGILVYPL